MLVLSRRPNKGIGLPGLNIILRAAVTGNAAHRRKLLAHSRTSTNPEPSGLVTAG